MIAETEEELIKRLNEWKDNVESKGMRVNMNKTKVVICALVTGFKQPLQMNDFATFDMLPFIPLHFLCTHFWQLVHCNELLPTPLLQTPHGHLTAFCLTF